MVSVGEPDMTTLPSFLAAVASAPPGAGHRALTLAAVSLPRAEESESEPEFEPQAVATNATTVPAQISFQLR
jgi:hypothetical protein